MKTKKLKARRMWANPLDLRDTRCAIQHISRVRTANTCWNYSIPVVVIPLDDVEDLIVKAANALYDFEYHAKVNRIPVSNGDCIRQALTAIGVLPKQRKDGGRK